MVEAGVKGNRLRDTRESIAEQYGDNRMHCSPGPTSSVRRALRRKVLETWNDFDEA